MEQWAAPCGGTLKISNPETLRKWIETGKYQAKIKDGWIFNVGCGRFRLEKCTCSLCRTRKRQKLQDLIDNIKV